MQVAGLLFPCLLPNIMCKTEVDQLVHQFIWLWGSACCYSQIWELMAGYALFWAPGFSFHPSTERPELDTVSNRLASLKKQEQEDSSCTLSQSDRIWGTYSSGFWPSLILTPQRKGLATSMNCWGFDKGGSATKTTEELITALLNPFCCTSVPLRDQLASDLPFTHTLWLICDHRLSWHAEEFPSGHRCGWGGRFQRAGSGSC